MNSAEALGRKKKICSGHRLSATRLLNQAEAGLAAIPPDGDEHSLLRASLREKLETLAAAAEEWKSGDAH